MIHYNYFLIIEKLDSLKILKVKRSHRNVSRDFKLILYFKNILPICDEKVIT